MIKVIKESFLITNNHISIATPLILFSLISTMYLILSAGNGTLGLIISITLFLLMLGAFLSGWFYMIKKSVTENDSNNEISLIKEFTSGVGEYFLIILGMLVNLIIISTVLISCSVLIGKNIIGDPEITYSQLTSAVANLESMKAFANSLSQEQLIKINSWNILIFFTMILNYFIIMFYPPAIYFKHKNPFLAFFVSFKDLFGRFFLNTIGLFLILIFIYFCINISNAVFGNNIFIHFIITLLNFYYLTFTAVLVFNYYYTNFAKIGSNIDKTI